ncbi:hypothetical protein PQE74_gp030 [Bacillus phage vB_BanS_Chewbecca]|uniref:Uncharacterized protein n=1 Tax=Bacillus phage vB_BanS_Chewbecca TaxID=2894786 RepID=A0AAE9CB05_9CAUD|nr:hypothetical protein PQE74_gp030 [Bacillus phage vB_BanS_Chewbecca]UGO46113.1 hypothetical protein CHEWBECCA_30 [Bacillus phage vB_BanS_Chewbecca]
MFIETKRFRLTRISYTIILNYKKGVLLMNIQLPEVKTLLIFDNGSETDTKVIDFIDPASHYTYEFEDIACDNIPVDMNNIDWDESYATYFSEESKVVVGNQNGAVLTIEVKTVLSIGGSYFELKQIQI